MEYEKDLFILEFHYGIVSSVNNSMRRLLFAYLKQKAFFILITILVFCFYRSYSDIDNSSRITIAIAIIIFISFYFWNKRLMNKKPKLK